MFCPDFQVGTKGSLITYLGDMGNPGDFGDLGYLGDLGDLGNLGYMGDLGDLRNLGDLGDLGVCEFETVWKVGRVQTSGRFKRSRRS